METDLREACLKAIQEAQKPMSAAEISACLGLRKVSGKLTALLEQLSTSSLIHAWPQYRRSLVFGKWPLRAAVEEAFLIALDDAPLTLPKAAAPVSKIIGRVSEEGVLAELRGVAPKLAAARRIVQIALNRQSIVYMSPSYLGRQLPGKAPASPIAGAVLEAVERLQPGASNFVTISGLRTAPELRHTLDAAAIELADQGKLVLAPYGGPRPVPDDEKWKYIEDAEGRLFIGIAIPRNE